MNATLSISISIKRQYLLWAYCKCYLYLELLCVWQKTVCKTFPELSIALQANVCLYCRRFMHTHTHVYLEKNVKCVYIGFINLLYKLPLSLSFRLSFMSSKLVLNHPGLSHDPAQCESVWRAFINPHTSITTHRQTDTLCVEGSFFFLTGIQQKLI